MAKVAVLQTNFTAGELDPLMAGRVDVNAYANGLKSATNLSLLTQGGGTRRPGTWYRATLAGNGRVIPFDYDDATRYLLVLRNLACDVYGLDGTKITTLTTPWSLAETAEVTYSQLAETMILAQEDHKPQVIKRVSATSWTIADFAFEEDVNGNTIYQPFYKFADAAVTLTPSGTTGSITITASAAFFVAGHVGCRLRIYDTQIEITAVTSSTVATGTVKGTLQGKLDKNPFRTNTASKKITVTHVAHGLSTGATITFSGSNNIYTGPDSVSADDVASTELNTTQTITVVDNDHYEFNVSTTNATNAVDGGGPNVKFTMSGLPTRYWDEQVFSPVRGYPRAVVFHEARLWFAGPTGRPTAVLASRINRFFNFDIGTGLDNESIQVTLPLGAAIRHMVSTRHLQIFTATHEYYCPRSSTQTALTPATMNAVVQTPYGSGLARPVPFDGATLFVQANGKMIREFLFSDSDASYNSNPVSVLSTHLINQPVALAVLQGSTKRGEQYAFALNEDGTLSTFLSARAEKIAAWVPWSVLDGDAITSICVLDNALWMVVERGSQYFLEEMAPDDELTLDCATEFSGTASAEWDIGTRYAVGRTVQVISDDYYVGEFTVGAGNTLSLPEELASFTVGYGYEFVVETLPPNLQLPQGMSLGNRQRISTVWLWLDSTLSVTLAGNALELRAVEDAMESAPPPADGVYRFHMLGYSRQPSVRITQGEPLRCRILALKTRVVA